jgi:predicted nuclease of predicted toxin-antitoxin system
VKLLFDQNISHRILFHLGAEFPDAEQVKTFGLGNATDKQIWEFARKNDFAIVTFDSDFFEMSSYFGHPPKIVWLRTGNRRTLDLANRILSKKELISEFLANGQFAEVACLEVD